MLRPLLERRQAADRNAELVGWLVAAREAMVSNIVLDADSAEDALDWAAPWVVTRGEQAEDSTAARCLQHLMASQVQTKPGTFSTVAELVGRVLRPPPDTETDWDADRVLAQLGLRLAPRPIDGGGTPGLYVAAGRRPGLARLFQGTEWEGGRWGPVLAQLRRQRDGRELRAETTGKQRVRFSGENDRCAAIWLVRDLLPDGGGT